MFVHCRVVGFELFGLVHLVFLANVAVAESVGLEGCDDELDEGLAVLRKWKGV